MRKKSVKQYQQMYSRIKFYRSRFLQKFASNEILYFFRKNVYCVSFFFEKIRMIDSTYDYKFQAC